MPSDPHITGAYGPMRIVAIIASLALIFWTGQMEFRAIDLVDVSLRQLGELLAAYIFLALLVERAVELILNWRFGAGEVAILAPLKQAAARHNAEMEILSRELDILVNPQDRITLADDALMRSAQETRQTLPATAAATREKLDDLSLHRRRWATWCAMGLSAGLALSGFQMLHAAFATQIGLSQLPKAQMQLFTFVDICLTTVVMAGGAGGIHKIISRLLEFGQKPKTGILPD